MGKQCNKSNEQHTLNRQRQANVHSKDGPMKWTLPIQLRRCTLQLQNPIYCFYICGTNLQSYGYAARHTPGTKKVQWHKTMHDNFLLPVIYINKYFSDQITLCEPQSQATYAIKNIIVQVFINSLVMLNMDALIIKVLTYCLFE